MMYAHSKNGSGVRQKLVEHLLAVARLAQGFASKLGAPEAGHFLGLWHDLGKFNPAFQTYLNECDAAPRRRGHGPDHKAAGVYLANQHHLGPGGSLSKGTMAASKKVIV